jgi:hypothetical protein
MLSNSEDLSKSQIYKGIIRNLIEIVGPQDTLIKMRMHSKKHRSKIKLGGEEKIEKTLMSKLFKEPFCKMIMLDGVAVQRAPRTSMLISNNTGSKARGIKIQGHL